MAIVHAESSAITASNPSLGRDLQLLQPLSIPDHVMWLPANQTILPLPPIEILLRGKFLAIFRSSTLQKQHVTHSLEFRLLHRLL